MSDFSCRIGFSPRMWTVGWLVGTALTHPIAAGGQERPTPLIALPGVFQLSQAGGAQANTPPDGAPLTLQAALMQARMNSQQLRSALLAAQLAAEDRVQAHAGLLPAGRGV